MRWSLILLALGACDSGAQVEARGDDDDAPSDPSDPSDPSGPSDPSDPSDPVVGPTWYQDVAPLVADRCGACHRDGGIGPFSVETYDEASIWAEAMLDSVQSGRMPPFFARESAVCDQDLGFQDDVRLTDAEVQLIADWIDADKPEGDPESAVPAPLRASGSIVDPDVELELQAPFEVTGTEDIYQCFRIPLPPGGDRWLTEIEVVPGNELVNHHVLVWSDPEDQSASEVGPDGSYRCSGFPDIFPTELVAAWTPGANPARAPADAGIPIHDGGSLVLNVHYHPTGTTTEVDRTRVRLKWRTDQPAHHVTLFPVDLPFGAVSQPGPNDTSGPEFRIPAGVPDHMETVELWIPPLILPDMPVFAVAPHMHYLGTEMLVEIDHTHDGIGEECLVHTPGYRFDFQQGYWYDPATGDLPVIHAGDRVRVHCIYDNSMSNPFMPLHLSASGATAPHDVDWGEETGDEMCLALVGLVLPPIDWVDLVGGLF